MRRTPALARFVRNRWPSWLAQRLAEANWSYLTLAQKVGTFPASRVAEWMGEARRQRTPSPDVVFRIGEKLGGPLRWVSGPVALYAAGWAGDTIGFLAALLRAGVYERLRAGYFVQLLPYLETLDWAIESWPDIKSRFPEDLKALDEIQQARSDTHHHLVWAAALKLDPEYPQYLKRVNATGELLLTRAREQFNTAWLNWTDHRTLKPQWPDEFKLAYQVAISTVVDPSIALMMSWDILAIWSRSGLRAGERYISPGYSSRIDYIQYRRLAVINALLKGLRQDRKSIGKRKGK